MLKKISTIIILFLFVVSANAAGWLTSVYGRTFSVSQMYLNGKNVPLSKPMTLKVDMKNVIYLYIGGKVFSAFDVLKHEDGKTYSGAKTQKITCRTEMLDAGSDYTSQGFANMTFIFNTTTNKCSKIEIVSSQSKMVLVVK